jgi:hypothetical protein
MIANDPEALADFREAVKEQGNNQHTAKSIPNNVREAKVTCGNGKAYTLSRLKRETPELFAAVLPITACYRQNVGRLKRETPVL